MNSENITFEIQTKDLNKLRNSNVPLAFVNDNGNEFGVLLHPVLGSFLIEVNNSPRISKTFFPKLELDDYYFLGRFAKILTNLNIQYKIFLNKNYKQKLLFSHVMTEKFYVENN